MASYRITPRAAQDLDDIADYTRERWGREQMIAYLTAIEDRFQWLADNPKLGRERDDVFPQLRSFRQGSHVVFYRTAEAGIEIVGLPHMAMDIDAFFQE